MVVQAQESNEGFSNLDDVKVEPELDFGRTGKNFDDYIFAFSCQILPINPL